MNDIGEIFASDPLRLTTEDRQAMIAYMRNARAQFNLGAKTAGKAPKAPAGEKPAKGAEAINLDNLFD